MSRQLGPVKQSRPWFIDLLSAAAFLVAGFALVKVLRGFPIAAVFAGIIALGLSCGGAPLRCASHDLSQRSWR